MFEKKGAWDYLQELLNSYNDIFDRKVTFKERIQKESNVQVVSLETPETAVIRQSDSKESFGLPKFNQISKFFFFFSSVLENFFHLKLF